MRRRDDHGNAAGDMLEDGAHHALALGVGQHELLGEICEDAEALRSGVDHEIDTAALAVEVEVAAGIENGRRDGEDAAIGAGERHAVFRRRSSPIGSVRSNWGHGLQYIICERLLQRYRLGKAT